ncbi:hypothetical protein ACJW30_12G123100 [Castanea mollissima]
MQLLGKNTRELGAGSQRSECPFQNSDWDGKQEVNGHSTSEDMEWQARSQWPFDPRRYGARHICLLKTTFKNDTEFSSSNSKVLADRLQRIKAHSRVNHGRFHCLMPKWLCGIWLQVCGIWL